MTRCQTWDARRRCHTVNTHFKDHFSKQSAAYSGYRPGYPADLFRYLASTAPSLERAWDCATGTGQAAMGLADHFREVVATDASAKQIANAGRRDGIVYGVAPAERTAIASASVDLVVAAQALHWFDPEAFYGEVKRVLKSQGVIAVWSYGQLRVSPAVDAVIAHLYGDIVGPYWPPERRLVEEGYRSIPFPFEELQPPPFEMTARWPLERMMGYLGTWSAVQRYKDAEGADPLLSVEDGLMQAWGDGERVVRWPLSLRIGVVGRR